MVADQRPHEPSGVPQGEHQGEVTPFTTEIRKTPAEERGKRERERELETETELETDRDRARDRQRES